MSFRPALRPGAVLVRRDARHLQVGTAPGIVLVDRPGLAELLRLLDGVRDLARIEQLVARQVPDLALDVADLLARLRAAGAVVDASELEAGRRPRSGRPIGFISSAGTSELVAATSAVLVSSGVDDVTSSDPEVLLIVSHGEGARSVFEKATQLGLDHLPVVVDEDRVRIGPLVRPGSTPCITCHDLHRADWDPAWSAIVPQLGRRPPPAQPSGLAGLTMHAAAVEVAAEVVALLDERPLRTAGRCLVVGPQHDHRDTWPVAFHHRCTCALLSAA
jgi:bacteriocin biosynthesis cyclodehydratase domain-containing protein